jgi:hypothetical protein
MAWTEPLARGTRQEVFAYRLRRRATIFIPQGTCIGVTNVGADTLSNFFVFSSPGFERALRAVSSAPGEPAKPLTQELRRSAFHDAHAVADPTDC